MSSLHRVSLIGHRHSRHLTLRTIQRRNVCVRRFASAPHFDIPKTSRTDKFPGYAVDVIVIGVVAGMTYWWSNSYEQMPDFRPGESDVDVRERLIRNTEFGKARWKQYESHKPRGAAHDDQHKDDGDKHDDKHDDKDKSK